MNTPSLPANPPPRRRKPPNSRFPLPNRAKQQKQAFYALKSARKRSKNSQSAPLFKLFVRPRPGFFRWKS
jgi:hypothetical protein